jgi:hypothetical protein
MERNVWMVEHGQQLGLVGVQPLQQAIQTDEASTKAKYVVEPSTELIAPAWCRGNAVVFQIGIELPDQRADTVLGGALVVGERVELVHQPFGMDPTQSMLTDGELARVATSKKSTLARAFAPVTSNPRNAMN